MLREATGAKSVFGEPAGIECADILLEDGDELEFGNFSLKAIATPGHTDACTSFYTEGMLLYRRLFVDSRLRTHLFPVG